jgi:hypothetical protein
MKRNSKPFSVEIKKSRDPSQHRQLPPRRLFEATLIETTKPIRKEEPQIVAEPAAVPRILPSILEPVWSKTEAVEPVRCKRSSGSKVDQGQIELDLTTIAAGSANDAPAETPVILEVMSQMDAAVVEEDLKPIREVQPYEIASAKAKSRKKAPKMVVTAMAYEPMSQPVQASKSEAIELSPLESAGRAGHHTLTERRAAAARLPRHERWKRRLHPAAW